MNSLSDTRLIIALLSTSYFLAFVVFNTYEAHRISSNFPSFNDLDSSEQIKEIVETVIKKHPWFFSFNNSIGALLLISQVITIVLELIN